MAERRAQSAPNDGDVGMYKYLRALCTVQSLIDPNFPGCRDAAPLWAEACLRISTSPPMRALGPSSSMAHSR